MILQTHRSDPYSKFATVSPDSKEQLHVCMATAGQGSRLQQIAEWLGGDAFDGALVFDECHRAKNCIAKQGAMGRKQNESKTSRVSSHFQSVITL